MALNRSLEPKIKTEPKINPTALRTAKKLYGVLAILSAIGLKLAITLLLCSDLAH